MVYSRQVIDQELTFGISGRLYKSNVLLYDHQTDSLWSQLLSKSISGPQVGRALDVLPSFRMRWEKWRKKYPHTVVLSTDTGHVRDYATDPYQGYYRAGGLMFPVGRVRTDLPAKARVVGIAIGDQARAYPLEALQQRPGRLTDRIGATDITIEIGQNGDIVAVRDPSGRPVIHMFVFWFAWQAFHPQTSVFAF